MKELESQHFAPSNEIMDLGKIIKTVKKYYMICRWRLYGGSSESSNRFQSTQHLDLGNHLFYLPIPNILPMCILLSD